MVKFSEQKCSVYLCTFFMQPHHHQSNMAQMAQHTKCTKKAKEKGGREREKGGKNAGSNRKIKKKPMRVNFPTMTPLPWPFVSVKFWQCLTVKSNILLLFSRKLFFYQLLMLDPRSKYPTLPPFCLHFSEPMAVLKILEPALDKTYIKIYVTSKDSDQPVHSPSMAVVVISLRIALRL